MNTLAADTAAARAKAASVSGDALNLLLLDGRTVSAPLAWYPRLLAGSVSERNKLELTGGGEGVHWPDLDEDLSVESILAGRCSAERSSSFLRWLAARPSKPPVAQADDERADASGKSNAPSAPSVESSVPQSGQAQRTLIKWAATCSHAIAGAFDRSVETLKANPVLTPNYPLVLRQLLDSCHLSSESALILISNVKLWDAESLLRSITEGTFKFVYLCLGSLSEIDEKFTEFDVVLPNISRLKRHTRVSELLSAVRDSHSAEWHALRELLLSEEEVIRLRDTYPRNDRQRIEQKWSFQSIAETFAHSGLKGLESCKHLFFGYGDGSHTLHQDSDGIGMLWERNQRNQERREAVEMAHAARQVSDIMVMAFLRYFASLHLCASDTEAAYEHYSQQDQLLKELAQAQLHWHDIEYPKS